MPRKSVASLAITARPPRPTRLRPPATLSEPERKLFVTLVGNCSENHFRESDAVLLCRYVEAAVLAEKAALELRDSAVIGGKVSPWLAVQEKSIRALTALSMRLRLSPQARAASNVGSKLPRLSVYEELRMQSEYADEN